MFTQIQHIKCIEYLVVEYGKWPLTNARMLAGLILGLRPANERRRYFVTTSLIGWAQT